MLCNKMVHHFGPYLLENYGPQDIAQRKSQCKQIDIVEFLVCITRGKIVIQNMPSNVDL